MTGIADETAVDASSASNPVQAPGAVRVRIVLWTALVYVVPMVFAFERARIGVSLEGPLLWSTAVAVLVWFAGAVVIDRTARRSGYEWRTSRRWRAYGAACLVGCVFAAAFSLEWAVPLRVATSSGTIDRLTACALHGGPDCPAAGHWNLPMLGNIGSPTVTGNVVVFSVGGGTSAYGYEVDPDSSAVLAPTECLRQIYGNVWEFAASTGGCPFGFSTPAEQADNAPWAVATIDHPRGGDVP